MQRITHRFCFAAIRHAADEMPGGHDRRTRDRQRLTGSRIDVRKMTFADLLGSAASVERHRLNCERVVKIGGGIVERNMAVLPNPTKLMSTGASRSTAP